VSAAALVVHDLKNELGALEAALLQLSLHPVAGAAAAAHRQCQLLRQRLVMYLTAYGAEGELRAFCEDESPADLLAAMAARHAPAGGTVCVGVDAGGHPPPFAYFDRRLVTMALDAALHNALRFARQRITLGVRQHSGHLVFSVEDDGPGLSAAPAAELRGTGLGTTLCRAVARAHGTQRADGGVFLENSREGGARFELWLAT
jgi:signal transduction histidine kinase